jgi:hypothetical protein
MKIILCAALRLWLLFASFGVVNHWQVAPESRGPREQLRPRGLDEVRNSHTRR